jgi:hypothetical protein
MFNLNQGFLASLPLPISSIRGRPVLRRSGMSLVAEAGGGVAPSRAGGGMSRLILLAAPWERRQACVRTSARVHELVPSHRPSEVVGKDAARVAVAVDHLIRSAATSRRRLVVALALVLALRHVNFAATGRMIRMRCMRQSKIQRSDKRSANRLVLGHSLVPRHVESEPSAL